MFPWFPVSYIFELSILYNEADSCCSSEQLEGASKGRCAEDPLLVHKPPKAHHWLIIRVKWLMAALRRATDTRLVWRCDVQTETAVLDHFLCCSPPIKLRSVCVNVSNDRENGCPPLSSPSCLLETTRSCCSRKKKKITATMFSSGESAAGNSPQDLELNYFFKVSHVCAQINLGNPKRIWLGYCRINKPRSD